MAKQNENEVPEQTVQQPADAVIQQMQGAATNADIQQAQANGGVPAQVVQDGSVVQQVPGQPAQPANVQPAEQTPATNPDQPVQPVQQPAVTEQDLEELTKDELHDRYGVSKSQTKAEMIAEVVESQNNPQQ